MIKSMELIALDDRLPVYCTINSDGEASVLKSRESKPTNKVKTNPEI